MITQYTRLIKNADTGEIIHCISQTLPFADNYDPVNDEVITNAENVEFELDTDNPDMNFKEAIDQPIMRAREILETIEVVAGQPQIKAGASKAAKVLRVSAPKAVNETAIKEEMAEAIRVKMAETGQTDAELIEAFNDHGRNIAKLEDLSIVPLIKTKKLLGA